jgi:hypothetical protein
MTRKTTLSTGAEVRRLLHGVCSAPLGAAFGACAIYNEELYAEMRQGISSTQPCAVLNYAQYSTVRSTQMCEVLNYAQY